MQQTLLLNASYEPLSVISWQRAMTMWCLKKVEVIAEYDERQIHSASSTFRMPSVVRLLQYVRRRYVGVRFSRQNIYARDSHQCQYCGRKAPQVELTLDHVFPKSRGGRTSWENIVACCVQCNRKKGGLTPKEARMKLLKTPIKPSHHNQLDMSFNRSRAPHEWLDFLPTK
tara:strand:- start:583 stop:1095 length:513 start_codon:yes stop_codon:yes gene_type:complete